MGLLDILAGMAGAGQNSQNNAATGNTSTMAEFGQLAVIWQWIQEQGGIQVLLQKFQQGGLGSLLESWIGNGQNQTIGGNQLQSAFAEHELQSLAGKLGTDTQGASAVLSQLLPQLVDGLSPEGHISQQVSESGETDLANMVNAVFKR